jgi:uncharacterized damage-inducible protein DinB
LHWVRSRKPLPFASRMDGMRFATVMFVFAAGVAAQTNTKNPLIATSETVYGIAKKDITGSVDKIPDNLWSFQPTPDVRTVAQLFAHVADGQYEFCGAADGKPVDKGIEKSAKTKEAIVAALKDAFAYCDAVYSKMSDADAANIVDFFGRKATKLGIMDFNTAHTMEHYGNLVTYMRLKNIVPPSSQK